MPKGTILAFDFGLKRIGVAVGEFELKLAHPLDTLTVSNPEQTMTAIEKLVKEWQPEYLLVGQPHHDSGAPHRLSGAIKEFVNSLKQRTQLEVVLSDESYSSAAASMALRDAGINGRKQKAMLDSVAAQEILQGYFENHGINAR